MPVVVQRSKLRRELRDDRRDERNRKRRDQGRVDQRVEPAVDGDPEFAAGNRVRHEPADVEHHAGGKDEKALLQMALVRNRSSPRRSTKVPGGLTLPFIEPSFS